MLSLLGTLGLSLGAACRGYGRRQLPRDTHNHRIAKELAGVHKNRLLKRPSLNFITGGPSAGKTSLVGQLTRSHFAGEPFFIPGLDLPEGPVVWVQTDRGATGYHEIFTSLGILDHPDLHTINITDDDQLHKLTRPEAKIEEFIRLANLRKAIEERITRFEPGTVILDLYEEFQTGRSGDAHRMAFESRSNLRWAMSMNVCLIGIPYTFKQTTMKRATRAQDRQAGSLLGQASANYKIAIVDPEETGKACSYLHVKPGPGEGHPAVHKVQRNPQGFFEPYDGPDDAEEAANEKIDRDRFLTLLPDEFSFQDAAHLAETRHICSRATLHRWLDHFTSQSLIRKLAHGLWAKA